MKEPTTPSSDFKTAGLLFNPKDGNSHLTPETVNYLLDYMMKNVLYGCQLKVKL
jgi:hypothetical protein